MKPERTWKDVVVDALRQHGGEASLKEITEFALKDPKAKTNTTVREKVRQVVRAYSLFETTEEGSGVYRLVSEEETASLVRQAATKRVTNEIQGKLLYIGRVNNYETFAPAEDRSKRKFGGEKLERLVTVRDLSSHRLFTVDESRAIARIDVLWLRETDGELIPRFAFEVENSTKIIAGLNRLNTIPRWFQTRLFIVGEDEKQRRRYEGLLNDRTFRPYASRFEFKYFEEVRKLFDTSEKFDHARAEHETALKDSGLFEIEEGFRPIRSMRGRGLP
ncbi:MAG TPA: hypothetical protein VF297_02690 [Pyrinomonadaceae bacterium]